MSEDTAVVVLLLLFVVLILTKRVIPWWIYERSVEKLRQYQDAQPKLLDVIRELMDLITKGK